MEVDDWVEGVVEQRIPVAWTRNSRWQAFYYSWGWELMCVPQWALCVVAGLVSSWPWGTLALPLSGGVLFAVVAYRRRRWVPRRRAYLAAMTERRERVRCEVALFADLTRN